MLTACASELDVDWPGNRTGINVTEKVTTEQAKSKRRVCSMLVESGARHRAFAPTANKYMSGTLGALPGKRADWAQLKACDPSRWISQQTPSPYVGLILPALPSLPLRQPASDDA